MEFWFDHVGRFVQCESISSVHHVDGWAFGIHIVVVKVVVIIIVGGGDGVVDAGGRVVVAIVVVF